MPMCRCIALLALTSIISPLAISQCTDKEFPESSRKEFLNSTTHFWNHYFPAGNEVTVISAQEITVSVLAVKSSSQQTTEKIIFIPSLAIFTTACPEIRQAWERAVVEFFVQDQLSEISAHLPSTPLEITNHDAAVERIVRILLQAKKLGNTKSGKRSQ